MRILIVDPEAENCETLKSKFTAEQFESVSVARSSAEALAILSIGLAKREPIELVILSLTLPDRPGLETLDEIHNVFGVAVVVLAGREERQLASEGLARGANDYVLRPVNSNLLIVKIERLLTRRFLEKELRRSTARNETLFLNVLAVMAKVLEAKDPYTQSHSQNVSTLASAIAREMGFPDDEVRRIGIAGILHDIGKMGIQDSILKKPGPLNAAEREMVERHPMIASLILEPIEQLQTAVGYVKHHHERFDGTGYPDGLAGDQIPLGARTIHAAEAFDAMVAKRSYNVAKTPTEALQELRRCAGTQFDPQVVDAMAAALEHTGYLCQPAPADLQRLPELLEDLTGKVSC
jgi:putative nucleotidyltransferase with HDIG domain